MPRIPQLNIFFCVYFRFLEASLHRCSYKNMFGKFAANLQENSIAEVGFKKIKLLCNFIEIALRHSCSSVNMLTPLEGCWLFHEINKISFAVQIKLHEIQLILSYHISQSLVILGFYHLKFFNCGNF